MDKVEKNQFIKALIPPGILAFLTFLIYYPSLHYPFQFDDIANISKRFGIRFDNPLERWWGSSRWFGDWLNVLNFQIGKFDPFYYRLVNVVIHLLAGLCVFYLILNLCKFLKEQPFFYNNAGLLAFASSALFLLHPVQTQTVSYVIQARLEGLASLFVLATLLTYVKAVQTKNMLVRALLIGLFALCALISCGTKELVIVMPILLVLIDWFFISQQSWASFKSRLWVHLLFVVCFVGIMIHYLGSRFAADALTLKMSTGNNRGNILTPHAFDIITSWQFFISEFRIIVHYLLMFIWPFDISVEYDWKIVSGFFSLQVIVPLLMLLTTLGFALKSAWQKKHIATSFGLLWFFIAIAPRSTLIPSPELACDYKTYLASVGVMFIIASGIVYALNQVLAFMQSVSPTLRLQHAQLYALSFIMLCLGGTAYQRNKVWESCVTFWEDNARKATSKARVHNNLGVALSEVGRVDEAIVAYNKAISLDAHYADPLSNLAVAHSLKGQIDNAIEDLKGAIHIAPNYPEAYNNLGTLLLQKKLYDDAEKALSIALQLRPYYGKAHYNMARLYEEKNDTERCWESLKKATEGDLDIPEVFFKLGQMSLKIQKYQQAAQAFEKTIQLGGGSNEQVWFNLANAYYMDGKRDQAETIYVRLVRDNPLDPRYAYNLAEVYFTKQDYPKALQLFRKTTTLPQPIAQAFFRAAHCLEKMHKVDEAKGFLQDLLALNAADDFKKMIGSELTRMSLQQKVDEGKGTIGLKDFKQALALGKDAAGKKDSQIVRR